MGGASWERLGARLGVDTMTLRSNVASSEEIVSTLGSLAPPMLHHSTSPLLRSSKHLALLVN